MLIRKMKIQLAKVKTSTQYVFTVNLSAMYVFCVFFTFFLSNEFGTNYVFTLTVLVSTVISYRYADVEFQVCLQRFSLAVAAVAIFAFANLENLMNSLSGDHWYHAFWAYVIPIEILLKANGKLPDIQMSVYLRAYAMCVVFALFASILIHRISKSLFIILFIIVSFGLIFAYSALNVSSVDPHPALRLLPLSILGVFGFDSWIFRLQGAFPIAMLVYYLSKSSLDCIQKLYCLAFLFSLPIIYFNTLLVEFSIWAFAALTFLYLQFLERRALDERSIVILGYVLALTGLIRGTAFFGLIPLCFYAVLMGQARAVIKVCLVSIPTALYIIKSAQTGTPASYNAEEVFLSVPTGMLAFERLLYSLSVDSFLQLWSTSGIVVLGLLFFTLCWCIYTRRWLMLFIFMFSLAMFWSLFHLIRPILWGVPRYQLEYVAPFAMVGFFILLKTLKGNWRHGLMLAIVINISGILITYQRMPGFLVAYPNYFRGETPLISEKVFDTQQAVTEYLRACNGIIVAGEDDSQNMSLIFAGAKISDYAASVYASSERERGFKKHISDSTKCELNYADGKHSEGFYNTLRNTTVIIDMDSE